MIKTFTHKPDGLIQMSKGYRKIRLNQPWRSSAEMHPLHLTESRQGYAAKRESLGAPPHTRESKAIRATSRSLHAH